MAPEMLRCSEGRAVVLKIGRAVQVQCGTGDVQQGNDAVGHRRCEAEEDMYCSTGDAEQSNDAV